jgi:thymidylate synthase ThyX
MMSLIPCPYDFALGFTDPLIACDPQNSEALALRKESEALYNALLDKCPSNANYALLGGNRRNVLMTCNMRELYHFSRLRSDDHAQWDIRSFSRKIDEMVSTSAAGHKLGGKSEVTF